MFFYQRCLLAITICTAVGIGKTDAAVVTFDASDFGLNPTFSNVQSFAFAIDLADPITPGAKLVNPTINSVVYNVQGSLAPGTPSGFPGFNLQRTILGADFYSQGSSFSMQIANDADLSDGLQVSELVGTGPVFLFNGREVGTGRYHPALFQLNADGTGSIRNSNNLGGTNPANGMEVNVSAGQEYITELTFVPSSLTIVAVPEPGVVGLTLLIGALVMRRRR
jgi:hypothetical protein